jgi:hypothetical protein
MQRPEPQIATAEFLTDYRFVLRVGRLDLEFQGPPERHDPREIMYFTNYLSVEEVDAYWSDLWSAYAQEDDDKIASASSKNEPIDAKATEPAILRPLAEARAREAEAYLATLGPLSEDEAIKAVEQEFKASITRERIRKMSRPKSPRGRRRAV